MKKSPTQQALEQVAQARKLLKQLKVMEPLDGPHVLEDLHTALIEASYILTKMHDRNTSRRAS
jgi:hypothetical protein